MTTGITPSGSEISTNSWENEGGTMRSTEMASRDELQAELKKYGITPVQLTVFDWGGYRYSNLNDAIAAAKRLSASA